MPVATRLSIPRRVFLGFALVLSVAGLVSVASVVQHQRTAATLRLLEEGYLPLSLTVSELRATQTVFGDLLDRMLSERNERATRAWLNAGRRARPDMLARALSGVAHVEGMAPPAPDRKTLAKLRRDLKRVETTLHKGEPRYEELYQALDTGDRATAERVLADLRVRERVIDSRLRSARNTILARIEATSAAAATQQEQAITVLWVLAVVALLVGVGVTVWSQRMLSPLPKLQERVEAVARGDLAALQPGPTGDDELGRLAQEFERMVAALAARDQSLREASADVQRLQRLQAQILADLSAAVLVVDADGVLLTRNPAAGALFGLGPEAVGSRIAQHGFYDRLPELGEAVEAVALGREAWSMTELTLSGATPGGPGEAPVQGGEEGAQSDGANRLVNLVVAPFGPGDGREDRPEQEEGPNGRRQVLVVAEDVTDAARTKARLIQTERLAAIGRMAAHVTHEVRNPLSSIGLNVELLEDELLGESVEARDLLKAIHREIDRLRNVTDEYLRVARLPKPQLVAEDLADLARNAASFLRPELESAGVQLELDLPDDLPTLALDEIQFRQVLINLMKNAREAMPDGGTVHVAARVRAGGVQLVVSDTGGGMDPEQRERIFDLFYTTKKLGTGLGLPLTQQIVRAHGGRIRCDSTPGQGTRFELWFPVADEAVSTPHATVRDNPGGQESETVHVGGVTKRESSEEALADSQAASDMVASAREPVVDPGGHG
ncbi:MAG: ATP-binding protein [Myxococcales bacterium]|nr:ATP-binding protein [Myxococcales bacterium]